jgi:hypothetical protein
MVDQIVIDMSERLSKAEAAIEQITGVLEKTLSLLQHHKHLEDGTAAIVQVNVTRLAEEGGK